MICYLTVPTFLQFSINIFIKVCFYNFLDNIGSGAIFNLSYYFDLSFLFSIVFSKGNSRLDNFVYQISGFLDFLEFLQDFLMYTNFPSQITSRFFLIL